VNTSPSPGPQPHFLDGVRHATHKSQRCQAPATPQVFVGIPPPCDKKGRVKVPAAFTVVHLKPAWKLTYLERLAHEVGREYQVVTATLEEKREEKAAWAAWVWASPEVLWEGSATRGSQVSLCLFPLFCGPELRNYL
uniref:Uncharacterized protein n=1 Tax=Catagonus wagneri TaxID=51154 RepID=A0A8C3YF04_9CETA